MKTIVLTIALLITMQLQTDRGSITGRIRSADGTPASKVRVTAIVAPEQGPDALVNGATMASLAETDAAGDYRLENVPPGRYYVTAGFVDFPTYYPGSSTPVGATVVLVKASGTTASIDFVFTPPAVKVRGRITGASQSLQGQVMLFTPRGIVRTAPLAPDGTFEFSSVAPGTYGIVLRGQRLEGITPVITVKDKDVTGIELVALTGDNVAR